MSSLIGLFNHIRCIARRSEEKSIGQLGFDSLIPERGLWILEVLRTERNTMAWIKNAIIDLGVTAVIAVYAFTGATWAWWIIAIYTPLMVLLKVFGLSSAAAAVQQKASDVPTWFYHFLFAANVVLLLRAFFYCPAAGWAAIWILSVVAEARRRPSKKSS